MKGGNAEVKGETAKERVTSSSSADDSVLGTAWDWRASLFCIVLKGAMTKKG